MHDSYYNTVEFKNILGAVLTDIKIIKGNGMRNFYDDNHNGNDEIRFISNDGRVWAMTHIQSCCESVSVEDIIGNLDNLIGVPILLAEEVTNGNRNKEECESETWTFYKLATIKGYVTIRWYGASNGYYSESVDFALIKP